ncbi:hypothetical protein SAMN05428983_0823 [Agrobacterium fabrum]|uniref:Uncharacterized protein n=1 Tax=Agrobacterium fabrum TaxID=1176649 RepID=A0A7Z7BHF4_9HYPH|nr:hypothetical protein [Agrobacterium fabrum]SDJ25109.1 hypothetical protein SAMN05428983_0823 [Agrobacterium fabrum]
MADKELGALSPIETLLAAALFHTVQGGNSRKVTAQQIADFVNGNYPAFIQALLSAQDADDVYAAIGAAPDADKLGGQLPSFFASAEAVDDALADKVPTSRTIAGHALTADVTLAKADVGLGNVDNTSDANKPVSTAQQAALDLKVAGPTTSVAGGLVQFTDATGDNIGPATIGSPAILGRASAGVGDVERLTQAQARQVLGGWEYINRFDLAGISQLDITGLGAFLSIRLSMCAIFNGQSSAGLRFSVDNGTTYGADTDEFRFTTLDGSFTYSTNTSVAAASDASSFWAPIMDHGGDSGWPTVSESVIHNFNVARNAAIITSSRVATANSRVSRVIANAHKRGNAQNAIRLLLNQVTTIQSGYIIAEGVRS